MAYIASHLKGMNRRLVYGLLREKGAMSKAEISQITGISPPTVMKIMDYFKSVGCVEEIGEGSSAIGRKPQLLRLKADAAFVLGIEFTGITLRMGLVDMTGHIRRLETGEAVPDFDHVIRRGLAARIDAFLEKCALPAGSLKGIGIGLPGRVNSRDKTIDLAPLEGIVEQTDYRDIEENLLERYRMPVVFENDANAAALGEFSCRGLPPDEDLLYIAFGKGIGAGIIIHGELRRGNRFLAGEIGYMVFDRRYVTNRQRAGWLEQTLMPERLTGTEAVLPDDLDRFSSGLAMAVVNLCVPLEIHHISLGRVGGAPLGEELIQGVRNYLKNLSVLDLDCRLSVCREPVIEGCAHLAWTPVLDKLLAE